MGCIDCDAQQPGACRWARTLDLNPAYPGLVHLMASFALKYRLERQRQPYCSSVVGSVPEGLKGVYALWVPSGQPDGYECVYVGKSKTCVRNRLLHLLLSNEANPVLRRALCHFGDGVEFSFAVTNSDVETDALERHVIQTWRPRANRNGREPCLRE